MPLHNEQLARLFKRGKRVDFAKGEFIVRPGELPAGVFYIEVGLVKSYNYTRYGEENLLSLRLPGQIIGLTTALAGGTLDIMYTALAPTVLWLLSNEEFFRQIQSDPDGSRALLDLLAELYRQHSEHILILEYRTVRERLVAFLLTLGRDFGRNNDGTTVVDVPLRHQDIASYINASRETTSREISSLEHKGLIDDRQGVITLKQIPKLQAYLEA